jgi:hypothetical protein
MSQPNRVERRVVCDACGQERGLFHKNCDGRWVTQQRTVTPWITVAAELTNEPSESLRHLVVPPPADWRPAPTRTPRTHTHPTPERPSLDATRARADEEQK